MSLALATSNDMLIDDHVRFISVSLSDNPVCFSYVSLSIWAYCPSFQIQAISVRIIEPQCGWHCDLEVVWLYDPHDCPLDRTTSGGGGV